MAIAPVEALEVVEDFTHTARCDEGFLQVRRLRVQNRRPDGSVSRVYRVDVVDRPRLDGVAVLVWRLGAHGREFLTRKNLRPAAWFRAEKTPAVPEGGRRLFCDELVGGLLEEGDRGEAGVRERASAEVFEEVGFQVSPSAVRLLGAPVFLAPGVISEKVFLAAVDVTGLVPAEPPGDGSPMEEGGELRWWGEADFARALTDGTVQDARTELAFGRFGSHVGPGRSF